MEKIAQSFVETIYGTKSISVFAGDITSLDFPLDVMLVSAFYRDYIPTRSSMIGALNSCGISVLSLAERPEIDLREHGNIWLSKSIESAGMPIKRIGCVELSVFRYNPCDNCPKPQIADIPQVIRSFFKMLDLATSMGMEIRSLGMPVPGTGNQGIDEDLVIVPLLNECLSLLKNNDCLKNICIFQRSYQKAEKVARFLSESYAISQNAARTSKEEEKKDLPLAFISYTSLDKNIADNLCAKLEANGIRAWYAPRNIDTSDYATSIVNAISLATHFIVILSHESLKSQHVLNEVDLAFHELNRGIRFYPMKIDAEEMGPSFKYYLSRQHWMDATYPPLEKRLDEFVRKIRSEL